MKKILITGCAGFIGFHISQLFLEKNFKVIGVDNLNSYYDIKLKNKRLSILIRNKNFSFKKLDINNSVKLKKIFSQKIYAVLHFAAQAGVRYSIDNPYSYFSSNLLGFCNILQIAKFYKIKKFIFASSSSIYGEKNTLPFNENISDQDNPIQLYAATKRSNEIIARSYFNLFKMNIIGLRFFTVYGNFGRPDMAIFKFTKNIISEKKIEVYNYGRHFRDFTHIEDVKNAVFKIFKKSKDSSNGRYEIINVGSGRPVNLNTIIQILEKSIGKKAKIKYIKKQIGDVKGTFSDIKKLKKKFGFSQQISIKEGLENFVSWYKQNYKI